MFSARKLEGLYSGGGDSTKYGFPISPSRYAADRYVSEHRTYRSGFANYKLGCGC